MSWQLITFGTVDDSFRRLSDIDRASVMDDLVPWVHNGPPRANPRDLGGAALFEDPLPCGYTITYFASDAQHYVAILDVTRTRPS